MANYSKLYITSTNNVDEQVIIDDVPNTLHLIMPVKDFDLTEFNSVADYLASDIIRQGLSEDWWTIKNELGQNIDMLADVAVDGSEAVGGSPFTEPVVVSVSEESEDTVVALDLSVANTGSGDTAVFKVSSADILSEGTFTITHFIPVLFNGEVKYISLGDLSLGDLSQ